MNNFIKLNSSLSLSLSLPDHLEFFKTLVIYDSSDTPNFQRDLKFFEDSGYGEILKER